MIYKTLTQQPFHLIKKNATTGLAQKFITLHDHHPLRQDPKVAPLLPKGTTHYALLQNETHHNTIITNLWHVPKRTKINSITNTLTYYNWQLIFPVEGGYTIKNTQRRHSVHINQHNDIDYSIISPEFELYGSNHHAILKPYKHINSTPKQTSILAYVLLNHLQEPSWSIGPLLHNLDGPSRHTEHTLLFFGKSLYPFQHYLSDYYANGLRLLVEKTLKHHTKKHAIIHPTDLIEDLYTLFTEPNLSYQLNLLHTHDFEQFF